MLSLELLKKLPKCELHLHLDGSVRPSTLWSLSVEQQVDLGATVVDEASLCSMVQVSADCESLEQYLQAFDVTLRVLQTSCALRRVVYEVCEDASKQSGVRYVECRFSPILHMRGRLSLSAVMEAVCEGAALAMRRLPIRVGIIVCGMRQMDQSVSYRLAEIAWRYRGRGVVGFDLAGPEQGFSSREHARAFRLVRDKLINCTLHSGEGAGWESIADAITHCGAKRIGHGVALAQNERLLKHVADRRIAIECCVTSNLQTKAVASLDAHPVRMFFDAGVCVVPCVDNATVSNVTLVGEYDLLQRHFGFDAAELLRLVDNGFASAFLDATSRHALRMEAFAHGVSILRGAGHDARKLIAHEQFCELIGVDADESTVRCLLGESMPRCLPSPPSPSPSSSDSDGPSLIGFTRDLVRALPKADLHCTLEGSVEASVLWCELERASIDIDKELAAAGADADAVGGAWTEARLHAALEASADSQASMAPLKRLARSVLQTRGQIERGVASVAATARRDGVRYMELVVRPFAHTESGALATPDDAVRCVIDAVAKHGADDTLRIGVILSVSTTLDDPIAFYEVAQLAVEHRECGVCGVGIYGEADLAAADYRHYRRAFEFLQRSYVNVAIYAGASNVHSLIAALHDGFAARISGAFTSHRNPRLLNYLALHKVPIELSLTSIGTELLRELSAFAGSPFRFLIDSQLPIAICSFRGALSKHSRVDTLYDIIEQGHLDVYDVLKLLAVGFTRNFQPLDVRRQLFGLFRQAVVDTLRNYDFDNLSRPFWFPPSDID
jgi:adenosine deaminase